MRCRKLYEVYGIRPSTNTNVNSNTNTKIATPAQTCSTIFIILGIKQVVSISATECWTSDWSWPRGRSLLAVSQLFTRPPPPTPSYTHIYCITHILIYTEQNTFTTAILSCICSLTNMYSTFLTSTYAKKKLTGPTTLTSTPSLPSSSWLTFHHTLVE